MGPISEPGRARGRGSGPGPEHGLERASTPELTLGPRGSTPGGSWQ